MKTYDKVLSQLTTLNLKGITKKLDEAVNEAERGQFSYISFIDYLLQAELNFRIERRLQRNMTGAHFPVQKKIEDFEFGLIKGVSKMDISQVLEFNWIDKHENMLFFGPPGLGKTHLAISIGIKAVEKGYVVSFERMTALIKLLKTSDIQRSASFRLNRIIKSDLIIIDEIGYSPIERKEANLFFNLVSELYEKKSIIITSNKNFSEWAEMMGDEIMTTALLDRLLHHSKIFNLDGVSYRIKKIKKKEVK
ncbi:IS21-like element helper ATPase IstB [Candidatus Woesearchaeota archaeon]|nr:IS21-like element helper ATPase IstB [Candidatus Woesearchaeota archaeon]